MGYQNFLRFNRVIHLSLASHKIEPYVSILNLTFKGFKCAITCSHLCLFVLDIVQSKKSLLFENVILQQEDQHELWLWNKHFKEIDGDFSALWFDVSLVEIKSHSKKFYRCKNNYRVMHAVGWGDHSSESSPLKLKSCFESTAAKRAVHNQPRIFKTKTKR